MCFTKKKKNPPIIPPLYTVQADGAVGSEQDDHVFEDVEQQGVRVQLGDGGEGVIQVGGALVEPQLEPAVRKQSYNETNI